MALSDRAEVLVVTSSILTFKSLKMTMKFQIFWLLNIVFSLSAESWAQSAKQTLKTHELSGQKKVALFNGRNLDGWYTYLNKQGRDRDPDQVFKVENKMIHISGSEFGCITTREEYHDYDLEVEFKWGEKTFAPRVDAARDNGILIHSQGKDGAFSGNWMYSIECQIIEGGTGDFLVVADGSGDFAITCPVAPEKQNGTYIYQPKGPLTTIYKGRINWFARDSGWKDVKGFRGAKDVEKPVGKWNKVRILAINDDIYFYLNGVLVNRAMRVKPTTGRIQIQSEGAEMFVRKVQLTPLARKN
jgi:hypothetical protein